jgi:hypothetical protein
MSAQEIPAGSEFTPANAFIPNAYAAHAIMVTGDNPTIPATPAVLLDLDGYFQSDLPTTRPASRTVRIILEGPDAQGIIEGLAHSLELLDNIRRNQEGPTP